MDKFKLTGMVERVTNEKWSHPPIHKISYLPEGMSRLDRDTNVFNSWTPSKVLLEAKNLIEKGATLKDVKKNSPLFNSLRQHMFPEDSRHDYAMNYLSATLKGHKLHTGIVLRDDGGTGKSLLLDVMFKEILNGNYCKFNSAMLADKFNRWMMNKQFLFGDEIAHDKKTRENIADFLKGFITGDIAIRGMHSEWEFPEENKANMIVSSNRDAPIYIDDNDRRWSVFKPGVENPVVIPDTESWHLVNNPAWIALGINDNGEGREKAKQEAVWMAVYLLLWDTDLKRLSSILDAPERSEVVTTLRTVFQEFATSLKERNIDWFYENMPDSSDSSSWGEYDNLCSWSTWNMFVEDLTNSGQTTIYKDHVFPVFRRMFPDYRNINKRALTEKLKRAGLSDIKSNGKAFWEFI